MRLGQAATVTVALAAVAALMIGGAGSAHAAFPGDAGKLLYNQNLSIYDFDPSSQGSRLLAQGYEAQYSPDGTRIAFFRYLGAPQCEVVVMDADGSNQQTVTSGSTCLTSPSFSPDGTRLAVVRRIGESSAIAVIGVDGTNEETVITAPSRGLYQFPAWSPDGQKIAFSGYATDMPGAVGNNDIHTINVDGTGLVNLTLTLENRHNYIAPDWAPDGSQLVFTHGTVGGEEWVAPGIWMMNADGSNLHPILSDCPSSPFAVWSPDGQKIAHSRPTGGFDGSCGQEPAQLFTMDVDGSNSVQLTDGGSESKSLSDWQPLPDGGQNPDLDGDGVPDVIDSDGGAGSDPPGFSDSGTTVPTTGTVTAGQVTVVDVADPTKGVRITAVTDAVLLVCGAPAPFELELSAGMSVTVTCASVVVEDVTGAGTVTVTTPNGAVMAVFEGGESGEVSENGTVAVDGNSGGAVTVTVDGVSTSVPPGGSATFSGWNFTGFKQPVDNSSPPDTIVLNQVNAGQNVPLRWHVANADGSAMTTLASASVTVQNVACGQATSTDPVEEVASSPSGLQNLGGGNYQLNWKTTKAWAGTCKLMHLKLGSDAVAHDAYFKFK